MAAEAEEGFGEVGPERQQRAEPVIRKVGEPGPER